MVIDGVTVTYATLHNPADITRRGLMLGDRVFVYRAGDVIPRVEAPLADERTGAEQPIVFPEVCPRCGDAIDTSEQRWRCVRGRGCQAVASIRYAVGRDQLDVEGLGGTRAVQLVDAGLVTDIADLFTLTKEQLLTLERMGDTSADNLLAGIEAARTRPLGRVFAALGVRGTGRSLSRRIAAHFGSMAAIRAADADTLAEVDGIGVEKARVIVAELASLAPVIDKLIVQNVGTAVSEPTAAPAGQDTGATAGPLAGETVVVTGSMSGALAELSRNAVNELIERAGARPRPRSPSAPRCSSPARRPAPSAPRPRSWASGCSPRGVRPPGRRAPGLTPTAGGAARAPRPCTAFTGPGPCAQALGPARRRNGSGAGLRRRAAVHGGRQWGCRSGDPPNTFALRGVWCFAHWMLAFTDILSRPSAVPDGTGRTAATPGAPVVAGHRDRPAEPRPQGRPTTTQAAQDKGEPHRAARAGHRRRSDRRRANQPPMHSATSAPSTRRHDSRPAGEPHRSPARRSRTRPNSPFPRGTSDPGSGRGQDWITRRTPLAPTSC
ncbi:hypothetical protein GCM10025734_08170 [Kitasatospora paranensis]